MKSSYRNFEPRLGFAWRLFGNNDTVLRAGYGRFYEIVAGNVMWNYTTNPPLSRNLAFQTTTMMFQSLLCSSHSPPPPCRVRLDSQAVAFTIRKIPTKTTGTFRYRDGYCLTLHSTSRT